MSPYPPDTGTPWYVWAILVLFGLAALIGVIVRFIENQGRRKRGLPPEPWSDISPAMRSLLSGRDVPAYTAPVNAVTPGRDQGAASPLLRQRAPVASTGSRARFCDQEADRDDGPVGELRDAGCHTARITIDETRHWPRM